MANQVQDPTIVLIGGPMTLDTGERLDSRQPIDGDKWDFVLRSALARSPFWWQTARTLVDVLLAGDESEDAWALAWAPRMLWRPTRDGSFKGARLRSVLPDVMFLVPNDPWQVGSPINASQTKVRYRALDRPDYFEALETSRPPTVFFGVHPTQWDVDGLAARGESRSY